MLRILKKGNVTNEHNHDLFAMKDVVFSYFDRIFYLYGLTPYTCLGKPRKKVEKEK